MAPGGVLIVGSASRPFVYKVRPGSSTAEKFIDASAKGAGTFFFGMLAHASSNTLWTCQLTPVLNTTPVQRHTALRSFELSTGAAEVRWNLPGDKNVRNDFSIGPDKALYITDTANAKIYKLLPGASAADRFLEDPKRPCDGMSNAVCKYSGTKTRSQCRGSSVTCSVRTGEQARQLSHCSACVGIRQVRPLASVAAAAL